MLQKFRYRVDNVMGRGAPALIGVLAVLCCLLAALNGLLLLAFAPDGIRPDNARSSVWDGFLRVLSPTILVKDRGSVLFLGVAILMAFGGIMLMSTLIPVISAGLQNQLARLRAGRTPVVETGHTVILGWSSQVHVIVAELVEANRSRRHACIAVLAEKDRSEMETEIRERVGDTAGTRIVCRTGNPADPQDVSIVSPGRARSVIVLAAEDDAPDFGVIKSLLAVAGTPGEEGTGPLLVAGVADEQNLAAARLAGGPRCRVVSTQGFIARLLVQSSLQSGLSRVYSELLDFAGQEIYLTHQPELAGRRFDDALLAFRASTVIGLMRQDGHILMNPHGDTRVEASDRIVVISEDISTIALADPATEEFAPVPPPPAVTSRSPGRGVLVLGSNRRLGAIVEQLGAHLPAGSRVDVVTDTPTVIEAGRGNGLELTVRQADITRRHVLEDLSVDGYDHVIVLCPGDRDPQEADAGTLATLLNLRDLAERTTHPFTLVTEMADDRNRVLAQAGKPDDLIVSGNFLSLRLSQISQNPHLDRIFDELFAPTGFQIALHPAAHYVPLNRPVTFGSVVGAVRHQGHLAIGHRIARHIGRSPHHGVELNPDREQARTYTDRDQVVLLTGSSLIRPD
ncbi:NAD-binding protein [Streptomyces sp.]|uniref:CASTOR/POLLUX-related putative ion channel n=1 Tax=Streptomyces sp. TaxID=1931 RepID=UPI0028123F49|nr:NAD-binding protein [Streptomyces sp.]